MHQNSILHIFRACRLASTVIFLLPMAILLIQHNLGLPRTLPQVTFAINTLPAIYGAVLIHYLHVSKPFHYFLILSTRQLPFNSRSSTHRFIPHFIYSCLSYQTSQTLHLENIHFPSLSTSETPCLCSMQRRWYNYSFLKTRIYTQSSVAQNSFSALVTLYTPQSFCVP